MSLGLNSRCCCGRGAEIAQLFEHEETERACLVGDRNALYLDHYCRIGEARHGDCGASWEIITENFCTKLSHARGVSDIDQKNSHCNHVFEHALALSESLFNITERLAALRIKIAGKRISTVVFSSRVSRNPDRPPRTFGNNRRRKCTLLLPCTAYEAFFHVVPSTSIRTLVCRAVTYQTASQRRAFSWLPWRQKGRKADHASLSFPRNGNNPPNSPALP
jgi:hypothetical protein